MEGPIEPVVQFGEAINELINAVPDKQILVRASLGSEDKPLPERWKGIRTAENLKLPALHSAPVGTFQYEARLTGLKPSTRGRRAPVDRRGWKLLLHYTSAGRNGATNPLLGIW
jgi:hypothetical protein